MLCFSLGVMGCNSANYHTKKNTMGLDMYITAKKHFYSSYSEDGNRTKAAARFEKLLEAVNLTHGDLSDFPACSIEFQVGYWRKANAVHGWFVKHVQEGKDDCRNYHVTREQLAVLKLACLEVLADHKKAEDLLPPTNGFFFGSTELDDGYLDDLENTVEIVNNCLGDKFKDWDLSYRASW